MRPFLTLIEEKVKDHKVDLLDKFKQIKRPLILDGAIGSQLQQKKIQFHKYLWSSLANITHPEQVLNLHKQYINAGAEIITTNTFRTNPTAYNKSNLNLSLETFVAKSVSLAVSATEGKEIIIAGSNAPVEDCYQVERTISSNDLDYNHKIHLENLWKSGCDVLWNETQSHWDEIEIICKFCSSNSLPFVVNLFFTEELKLLSGEPVKAAVEMINDFSALAIGFNCIKQNLLSRFFEINLPTSKWGFYLNCGAGKITDEIISCGIESAEYVNEIEKFLDFNPLFVGACCGSSPDHIKEIKNRFSEKYGS